MTEQANDPQFREVANTVGNLGFVKSYDRNGVLMRQARIDGAVEMVVPTSSLFGILYLAHSPVLAGHPGERQLYDTLRLEY